MVYKEVDNDVRAYMYTAELDNGVTIHAFADGTAEGSDGKQYRLLSHIKPCDFYDVFDETVPDGWVIIE